MFSLSGGKRGDSDLMRKTTPPPLAKETAVVSFLQPSRGVTCMRACGLGGAAAHRARSSESCHGVSRCVTVCHGVSQCVTMCHVTEQPLLVVSRRVCHVSCVLACVSECACVHESERAS
jgi:hypothetical protein